MSQVSENTGGKPVFLVGFSLGGNFALRIARQMQQTPIPNLYHVVAISPVLDPAESTRRVDRYPLIRSYFLKKWLRSLEKKQTLFPELYDFAPVMALKTIQAVTDALLERYSEFESAGDYFREYSLLKDAVREISVDTTIISARNDPIIPIEDFYQLELNERTYLSVHDSGGHNGFIDGFFVKSWYENKLADMFDDIVMPP